MKKNKSNGAPAAWKNPPFALDKAQCGIPLTRQVCAGFERAIDSGYYAPGDKIPPVRAQMKIFGVSLSVTEDAMSHLLKTGKVYARPRIGTVVADLNAPARRGSVVYVYPGCEMSYYSRTFGVVFAEAVERAGYSCTTAFAPQDANGAYDFSSVDRALLHSPDLVVVLLPTADIEAHLSEAGARFVVVGRRPCRLPGCVGWVRRERNAATAEFFDHCRKAGVRSVHQLYCHEDGLEVLSGVPHPGIRVEDVRLGTILDSPTLGDVRQVGYDGFMRRYAGCGKLPDLLFVTDDVMAAGVILALERLRIRVPEDVRLVTWLHRGDEPPAAYRLTRIETEPVAHGRRVAAGVLRLLAGSTKTFDVRIPPVYRTGRSFPAN